MENDERVIDIDSRRPHISLSFECKNCGHKWVAVYPEGTMALECPGCHGVVNQYGVRVLQRVCKKCGKGFTVCPYPENPSNWDCCLSDDCESYDPDRDPSDYFS